MHPISELYRNAVACMCLHVNILKCLKLWFGSPEKLLKTYTCKKGLCHCVQEQSSRREIGDLQRQLQSSEALVADFQKTLQQRDYTLEKLRAMVSIRSHESVTGFPSV